jgi:hypothetical protein
VGTFPDGEYSDSEDSAYIPDHGVVDLEEEDEVRVGPAIQYERTQNLRNCMTGRLVDKTQYILEVMDSLGINLTIFLDAVSWGVQPIQRYGTNDQV